MELSAKRGIQKIILALEKLGLKEVVICPGSRNSPLTISFNRHPSFVCTSIRDERSAAFYALGKALSLQQPVAVVCTSGSAALNFAPAVVEAYYQRVPLILITADRPKEWTDQGDGQTINQTHIYQNYIRKSYELRGEIQTVDDAWYNARCLSEGFTIAQFRDMGPVHFNIPLREPLYELAETKLAEPSVFVESKTEVRLSSRSLESFHKQFKSTRKVLVLIGQHRADERLQRLLAKISTFENVVVLTESTSNMHHPDFVEHIDRCITHLQEEEATALRPEILITFGGAIVSKRIKSFLRQAKLKNHWNVHPFDSYMDTYQALSHAVPMTAQAFLQQVVDDLSAPKSDYKEKWQLLKGEMQTSHNVFCREIRFSDFYFFNTFFKKIPENIQLHLSNSSPIRYMQLFEHDHISQTWCNRGTSGIDGSTSTAMGISSALPEKEHLLVTGDVAFYYDINALWNEERIENLKIILINNGGGSIFRIIPGPDRVEERTRFLETAMKSSADKIAQHYDWRYFAARNKEELEKAFSTFFQKSTKRAILEVFTDPETNPEVLTEYWESLKENKHA